MKMTHLNRVFDFLNVRQHLRELDTSLQENDDQHRIYNRQFRLPTKNNFDF